MTAGATLPHTSRGLRDVRRFAPDEDVLMDAMRCAGESLDTIAETLSLRRPRRKSAVQMRLRTLAEKQEQADA